MPGSRFSVNMISTITNQGKVRWMIYTGKMNAALFIVFLTRLIAGATKKVFLIVDHLSVHEAAAVDEWLADKRDRIEVFYLPKYAPERNPDEYLNCDVKANINTDGLPKDREELTGKLRRFMQKLAKLPARVASYFEHKCIAYAAVPELNPHLRLPGRARPVDVRGRVRQHAAAHRRPRTGRRTSTRAPTPTTRSTGCVKNVPNHNGKVGQWGISYPGFYTVGRDDRRPPGAEGGLAAGAGRPTGSSATTGTTTARSSCRTPSTSWPASASPGPSRPRSSTAPFDHGTPDGYEFFLEMGPLANADAKYFKGEVAVLERGDGARHLRRLLEGPQPPAAPQGHQAGRADRRRLVRRREPVRRARDLQGASRRTAPSATNILVMGPWLHGGWSRGDGDTLGDVPFDAKTAEFYREQIEFPFFEYHLKGKGDRKLPEGVGLRDRHEPVARATTPGRRRTPKPRSLYLHADGRLGVRRRRRRRASDGVRRVRQRPGQAGAVHRQDRHRHDAASTWTADQRFAARRPDVLVYQTDALEEDLTLAGPIAGRAVRLDDRHRLRLGRQADRRLPRRLPRPRPEPDRRAGWAATSSSSAAT